jgi:hypothetical protein
MTERGINSPRILVLRAMTEAGDNGRKKCYFGVWMIFVKTNEEDSGGLKRR